MFLGRVVGQVWATKSVSDLDGKRMLVIEAVVPCAAFEEVTDGG